MAARANTLEDVYSRIEVTGFCWNWRGTVSPKGYGGIWFGNKAHQAHRFMYEHLVGPIARRLQLDHLCRNTICVNPDHLEPVTGKINTLRSFAPTAINARKTHCTNGHEYNEQNTYHRLDGTGKYCRQCNREANTRYAARKRAA